MLLRASIALAILAVAFLAFSTFTRKPDSSAEVDLFAEELLKIRQASADSTLGMWRDRLLARARREAATPFPLKDDDNLSVAPIVARIAFAAALTHDEGLRDVALADMRKLLALRSWTSSRHRGMADLHTADTALAVALAYHVLRQQLTSQEKGLIRRGLSRLAFKPYLNDSRRKRVNLTNSNNWNGVINGGLLAASLLLDPDGSERVESAARQFLPSYLNHFASDGGWDEAADYLWYGLRNPAFAAFVAGKLGRPLKFPEAVFEAPQWQEAFTSPAGRTPAFGDATWQAKPSIAAGYLALTSGSEASLRAFAQRENSTDPIDLLYLADLGELEVPPASTPASFYASPIGWAVARKGGAWLVVRGGSTSSNHAHLDLGSFILEVDGDLLLTDPGVPRPYPYAEGYFDAVKRWVHPAVRSSSHSTILVNGAQQTLTARMDARLEDDTIVGEMEQGYGSDLRLWRRSWGLEGDALIVKDHIELAGEVPVSWIFVTPDPWEQTIRLRQWRSANLSLELAVGATPESAQPMPAVLERAYPLQITLPFAQNYDVEWRFTWEGDGESQQNPAD